MIQRSAYRICHAALQHDSKHWAPFNNGAIGIGINRSKLLGAASVGVDLDLATLPAAPCRVYER
jgi:hypothetical protein